MQNMMCISILYTVTVQHVVHHYMPIANFNSFDFQIHIYVYLYMQRIFHYVIHYRV